MVTWVNNTWTKCLNSIDLLRHGQRRTVSMKTILVEVGEVHHVAIIKVGIEKEDWHLVNICLLLMLW